MFLWITDIIITIIIYLFYCKRFKDPLVSMEYSKNLDLNNIKIYLYENISNMIKTVILKNFKYEKKTIIRINYS